jgi:hypothetical protein
MIYNQYEVQYYYFSKDERITQQMLFDTGSIFVVVVYFCSQFLRGITQTVGEEK